MRRVGILLFLMIGFILNAEWIEISGNNNGNLFEVIADNRTESEIQFSLNGFNLETVYENGTEYQKITYQNSGEFLEVGKPDLPRFSGLIAIPNEGNVTLEIISYEYETLENILVYPRQELGSESNPNPRNFVIDEDFYRDGNVFPSEIAQVGSPAIMRDFRVVNLTVNPFQYNPRTKELKIFKNMRISIQNTNEAAENKKILSHKKSKFFEPLYRSSILNYDYVSVRDDYQTPCYLFIYPSDLEGNSDLNNLIEWKHQKGFEVVAASTSETGTSNTDIKNYIQNAYDNWENPPEFVCLVGDAGGSYDIPTWHDSWSGYNGEGDHPYSQLEGDDILADVFLGRLSFNSLFEFQTIVYKILYYEKQPYLTDTNWYTRALLVGDPSSSGQSTIITNKNIKEMINYSETGFTFDEVYSGSFVSSMNTSLNNGVSYFNYRGWLGMSGWDNSDTDNLTNGFMMPVAVIITCDTGSFEGTSDCRSEHFLKVGTPGSPKGAIASIGTATSGTHTCFNNCVDAGTYYGLFVDNVYNMGSALARGKLNLYLNYPDDPENKVEIFSYWNNLMGDPGMEVWTNVPQNMVVTYDSEVSPGIDYFEVTVEDVTRNPLENAWVTALMGDDDIFASGYTDQNGKVYLPINATTTGSVTLTVTKHNYIPHLGSFDITQQNVFLGINGTNIDDDNSGTSAGNGDGLINPGEDIEFGVNLKNFGTSLAYGISATISSNNSCLTITDNSETYVNLTAGSSSFSTDDFDFSVDSNALGGTEIIIDLEIHEGSSNVWTDKIYLTVDGPNLNEKEYTVLDGGNGILDPGETSTVSVTLNNDGSVSANNVYGTLSCNNSLITINDDSGYFGNVMAGGEATNSSNTFEITASSLIAPGTQLLFELHLSNADGYDNTISFYLNVGEVSVTDPLGPDDYGYYCYDDSDENYDNKPEYSWIEIDPNYGGSGTLISFSDAGNTGDIQTISLPFNLKFYGEDYSEITVCSNGWISPGITEQYSFMNWHIPGPMGPSPMIAAFWDDLKIASGNVYYFYDNSNNYFVVEWSHLQNEYDSSEETFQVIIYDANHYSSETGDCNLKFQYKTINNTDIGDYSSYHVQHGEYATVGIENHTSLIGLEYTYDNDYPEAAKPLQNEMAILFTTNEPTPPSEAYLIIDNIVVNDAGGDGEVNAGEIVNLDIILNNIGLTDATGVSAVLSTTDAYTTISQNNSNYNDVISGTTETNLTDYVFSVSDGCSDGHQILFDLNIHSNENDWLRQFQLQVQSPNIEFESVEISDGENYTLDPGETTDLDVTIINNGGADATNLNVILSSTDSYITINNNSDSISSLVSGNTEVVTFNISVSASAPVGHVINFHLDFDADNNYIGEDDFSVTVGLQVEDFETGDFSSYSWEFGGNADWVIDSTNQYEGSYCAQSGDISHNQISDLVLEAEVTSDGTISFYRKVSSENNYDYLRFYIDNVLQERWSGEVDWSEVSYSVTAGNHVFKWEYYKDGSVNAGSDCAWIDYIVFPSLAPPPQISVQPSSFSKSLNVGASTEDNLYIGNDGGSTLNYTARVVYSSRINYDNNVFDRDKIKELFPVGNREIKNPIHAPLIKEVDEIASRNCEFTVDLYDDYGDGWNGGYLDVLVNGEVVLNDITLSDGHGPETHAFQVSTGDQISTVFTAGSWSYECSYYICDNDGTQVASDGTDGETPSGLDPFFATCTNDVQFAWLTLDGENEVSGSIEENSNDDVITVLFDTAPDTLSLGTYEANIIITSNDNSNSEVIVPVTLNVIEHLDAPTNVSISISGNNLMISWDAVEGADTYKIVSDTNPYGDFTDVAVSGITETSWTTAIPANPTFYRVIAVAGGILLENKKIEWENK